MAIKTFTTGEVLTAADTNTYLANSGLVYVKTHTVTGTPTTMVVTNAFSSTYDSYKIVVDGFVCSSVNPSLYLTLGSTITGYYFGIPLCTVSSAAYGGVNGNNTTSFQAFAQRTPTAVASSFTLEILAPFTAQNTRVTGLGYDGYSFGGTGQGILSDTTSYTDFTFTTDVGTFTAGKVTVYGYRKA
jgi:hypothetical protein